MNANRPVPIEAASVHSRSFAAVCVHLRYGLAANRVQSLPPGANPVGGPVAAEVTVVAGGGTAVGARSGGSGRNGSMRGPPMMRGPPTKNPSTRRTPSLVSSGHPSGARSVSGARSAEVAAEYAGVPDNIPTTITHIDQGKVTVPDRLT